MGTGHVLARILILGALLAPAVPALALDAPETDGQGSRPVRVVYPGLSGGSPVPAHNAPSVTPPPPQPQIPDPPETAVSSAPVPTAQPTPADGSETATAEPADAQLVDINSASSDELDRLGGRFGKTIVRNRPYRSIDELVSRRILTRSTFGQIRDRITAR